MTQRNASSTVGVTYIHRRPSFTDNIYGTGLTFVPGQTRDLPTELARSFLRHTDVFERAPEPEGEPPANKSEAEAKPPTDDTKALLEKSDAKKDAERQETNALMDIKDSVARMDAQHLAAYAMTHYKQQLDKKAGVKALRAQVSGFIDQFGV